MHQVYFAHGYRHGEERLAAFLGSLMRHVGFLPSLDPSSDDVNAAKLERHLGYTDGLVAMLPYRDSGPSPHILFEIAMARRSGKPLLVFIDDRISDNVVPQQTPHRRFTRPASPRRHPLRRSGSWTGRRLPSPLVRGVRTPPAKHGRRLDRLQA